MIQETNQNETPKEPKVVPGSLSNALMRTFRGDANIAPEATPPPQSDIPTSPEPRKNPKAVVRTFKDDIQNLVRDKKMSMTRVAALESDRKREEPTNTGSKKNLVFTILGILLFVIAGVFSLGTYYAYQLNTSQSAPAEIIQGMIFIEALERVDITQKNPRTIVELLATIRRNTFFSLGSVVELYLTTEEVSTDGTVVVSHTTAKDFIRSINAAVPDTFVQTLGSEYILGIHVIDENVPFIILSTQSYGYAFAGMLAWEHSLESDLLPFFSPNAEFVKPASAEGQNTFIDTVLQNTDVRILKDDTGDIRMLYAFIDRNTVVITTDVRTLNELSNRLRTQ
ncbi:hypothetical protein COB18_03630 [Candidatus Kaiserbacteria bacterium]|nr:MAG: hypothetical protein COB18_03630 [Candidatus Kaiserbacteria bacterium]